MSAKPAALGLLIVLFTLSGFAQDSAEDRAKDAFAKRYGLAPVRPGARAAAPKRQAAQDLRIVGGKLYDAARSVLWKPFEGECLTVLTNGVILEEIKYDRVYKVEPVNELQSLGTYGLPRARHLVSETRVPGKKFFVRNYPLSLDPTTGKQIKGLAIRAGVLQYGADTLELWDYGVRYVSTNQITAPSTHTP